MFKSHFLSKRWIISVLFIVAAVTVSCLLFVSHQPSHTPATVSVPLKEHSVFKRSSIKSSQSNRVIVEPVDSALPSLTPTAAMTTSSMISRSELAPTLISLGKPVTASVRGNLGPSSVVTNERVEDWLKDRWQAAKNMQGEPILGEHWLLIDLQSPHTIKKVLIDWEQAFSRNWIIQGKLVDSNDKWTTLCTSQEAETTTQNSKHVVHEVTLSKAVIVKLVQLLIKRPSTRWGSSVWRFQLWGSPA